LVSEIADVGDAKMTCLVDLRKIAEPLQYALAPDVSSLQCGLLRLEDDLRVVERDKASCTARSTGDRPSRLNASVASVKLSTFSCDIAR
jgi:hypothetical protein